VSSNILPWKFRIFLYSIEVGSQVIFLETELKENKVGSRKRKFVLNYNFENDDGGTFDRSEF
jgi:hypothetical protein